MFHPTTDNLNAVLVKNISWLRSNIVLLLKAVGSEGVCKGCGQKIYWVKTKNGKNAPYTVDGLNHFADCRQAGLFKGQ